MKKFFILLVLFTTLVFFSCDNGGMIPSNSSGNSNSGNIKRQLVINFSDASNIYIGKSTKSASRSSSRDITENKLFKITEDGYVQEVTFFYEVQVFDQEGKLVEIKTEQSTETFVPTSITKLNDNYLLVCFNYNDNYLVDTKTGNGFKYPYDAPREDSSINHFYGESIQIDKVGNIYYSSNNKVLKIIISDPQNISVKQITPSIESVWTEWSVDSYGNCAYEAQDNQGNGVIRLKKESGGYKNLPGDSNFSHTCFWQGLDGNIYYYNSSNPGSVIKKIDKTNYEILDVPFAEGDYIGGGCGFNALLKAKNKNRTILVEDGSAYPYFHEVFNPDTNLVTTRKASDIGLNKIKFAISSDDYYYFVGWDEAHNCKVVKVNPVSFDYEYLLSDGEYDVYNLSTSNDSVIFNALRMSDGAIVMGKIYNDKSIEILDDKLEENVTVLERIN